MILDDLIQFLLSQGEITVLTGQRIRLGALFQSDKNDPAIRITNVSSPSEHDLSGPSGIVQKRIQLDIFSPDPGDVETLAEKVRLAMYGYPGPKGDENVRSVRLDNASSSNEKIDNASEDIRFRVRQDWLVWHTEAVPA